MSTTTYCPCCLIGDGTNSNSSTKYTVVINLHRRELLHDLKSYGFNEHHILPDEAEHARHAIADICEEGNIDRVDRLLAVLHPLAVELLYPFTKIEIGDYATANSTAIDDTLPDTDEDLTATTTTTDDDTDSIVEEVNDKFWTPTNYRIEMHVPSNFSRTTLHLLVRLIHEWMVYRILADWLLVNKQPDAAAAWTSRAEAVEEQINKAKKHRGSTFTRPLMPW